VKRKTKSQAIIAATAVQALAVVGAQHLSPVLPKSLIFALGNKIVFCPSQQGFVESACMTKNSPRNTDCFSSAMLALGLTCEPTRALNSQTHIQFSIEPWRGHGSFD